jgi:hypothetical protein
MRSIIKQLSQDQILSICQMYNEGKTTKEVAAFFKVSDSLIYKILKINYVELRSTGKIKFKVNENFFSKIDNEEKAYFLGFLYADGNLSTKIYTVSIELQERDKEILKKFKELISTDSPLKERTRKNNKYISLTICQKHICEQLIKLGCVSNKSLILNFPNKDIVPEHLVRHFIRGYSDGDGCISNYIKNNYKAYSWDIVSTNNFCQHIQEIIKKLHVNSTIRYVSKNMITSRLTVGGNNQTKIILDWLYQDANIYLQRKYDKYLDFINYTK